MTTKWMLVLLPAAMLSAADANPKAEKQVLAAMEAYRHALVTKDAAALSRFLSDDLTYTHSSNQHQDKAAVIESLKRNTANEEIEFQNLKVRIYGNTAVVTGDLDLRRHAPGGDTVSRLNVLHVLVKGPGGWQLVARQATRIPDAAPAVKK